MRERFDDVRPGQRQISARQYNALLDAVEAQSRMSLGPGVIGTADSRGYNFTTAPQGFWAKILGADSTITPPPHAWSQQVELSDGSFSDFSDQAFGSVTGILGATATLQPAYDPNGKVIATGTVVWLVPGKGGEYYEIQGAGGATGGATAGGIPIVQVNAIASPNPGNLYDGVVINPTPNQLAFSLGAACWIYSFTQMTLNPKGAHAANEAQSLSVTGGPTGGSFTLSFNGQTTAPINWNDKASTVQQDLQNLSTIGAGNVTVSGGSLPNNSLTIIFTGALGNAPQNLIQLGTSNLTGGSFPTVTITETSQGTPGDAGLYFATPNGNYTNGASDSRPLYWAAGGWISSVNCQGGALITTSY